MIRLATDTDMPNIRQLLKNAYLPIDGISEHRDHLYVMKDQGSIIGAVGYEAYGADALLRSLIIGPSERGQGYGRQLIAFIVGQAKSDGIRDAYALTTTIADWLLRLGFVEIARSDAPMSLEASEEFQGACPDTAKLFKLSIK